MDSIRRSICYFNQPGIENTEEVIDVVYERLKEGKTTVQELLRVTQEEGIL